MNKWIVLSAFCSTLSYAYAYAYAYAELVSQDLLSHHFDVPELPSLEMQHSVCHSLVCNSISEPQLVSSAGDFPERESNPTIDTITSAIYFVGEMGVAENLSTPEYEKFFEN